MIEIEISNFQAIRHVAMAVDGFAAIVGRSNIGKSAIVRAVSHALTGATGTDFVRHGSECDRLVRGSKKCKCFSKVTIRMSSMTVTWEKGDNVNRYTVLRPGSEPEPFEGLERGTPPFLAQAFQQIKVGTQKELVQVPDQFEPIFLLNQSGLAVADVLSDVAQLDDLNKAMGLANKDRKDAAVKRKVREEDVAKLQHELERYDGLDEIPVKSVVDGLAELTAKRRLLERVDGFLGRLASLTSSISALEAALKPEVPDIVSLKAQSGKLFQVSGFLDSLSEKVPVVRRLTGVDQVALPDDTELRECHARLLELHGLVRKWEALNADVDQWAPVESVELPGDPGLGELYQKVVEAQGFLQRLSGLESELQARGFVEKLPELDLDPVLSRYMDLDRVNAFAAKAKAILEAQAAATKELNAVQTEEANVLAELSALGVCPACEQPLGVHHRLHMEAV